MVVPALDRCTGMEVYSTDIQGIDGSIKQTKDQFIVEEILDNLSLDLTNNADEEHQYPLYLLKKEGIDSFHAIWEVELTTGLKLKAVGLKDAKAVTSQYVSSLRKRKDAQARIITKQCAMDLVGYTSKPITKGKLIGNRFTITITGFTSGTVERSIREFEEINIKNRIANFYGYQRFGSARAVTHLVGRELIKRNFRKAIELYLCYPGKYDSKEIMEMRDACKDVSNFQKILKILPLQMDLERILLLELASSNEPIRALRKLPITVRRLFVHAYQSYLFNRVLSNAIKEGYDIGSSKSGDVCFCFGRNTIPEIKRFDEDLDELQLPAIPMVGYAFRDDNRLSSLMKVIMEEENVSKNDFYVKELQEVSVEGGFRTASLLCSQFSHTLGESLELRFILNKGCYATVLLREIMKPTDPMMAGF